MDKIDDFELVEINMLSLTEPYKTDFINHTNDHSMIEQMFGYFISFIFRFAFYFDKTLAYNMLFNKIKEDQINIENYFRKDWLMYNPDHELVGTFGVRTHDPKSGFLYIGKRVLEISATICAKLRGKGIAKKLAPDFVAELKREYPNDVIVLSTVSNNSIVSHLAVINGFVKVHTYVDYVAFIPIIFDLYMLE